MAKLIINGVKPCGACSCYCWLVTGDCIVQLSEITAVAIIKSNHINHANDDVADLIGEKCFEELCNAIQAAIEEANQTEESDSLFDFLEQRWKDLISNRHFKKFYSNRVAFHWLEGASITQLKKVGLITTSNDDEEFKNSFKHADEKQRKRLSDSAANYASGSRLKFLKHFWNCAPAGLYDCAPGCEEDCNASAEGSGESIGFCILD